MNEQKPDTMIALLHSQHAMLMETMGQIRNLIDEVELWRQTARTLQERLQKYEQ